MARPTVGQSAEEVYGQLGPFAALDGEANDWALLRFCEVLTGGTFEQVFLFVIDREIDGVEIPGWGTLMDPDLCPAAALPYLGQYVGVTLAPDMTEQEQRDAIKLPENWKRGTIMALQSALERKLTGAKSILIDERYTDDAYIIRVRTFAFETPDPAAALQACLSQKVGGITLIYEAITGQDWDDLVADHADWDAVMADYATWDDVVADLP